MILQCTYASWYHFICDIDIHNFICYVGTWFSVILNALSMLTRVYNECLGNILKHTHAWSIHKIH